MFQISETHTDNLKKCKVNLDEGKKGRYKDFSHFKKVPTVTRENAKNCPADLDEGKKGIYKGVSKCSSLVRFIIEVC